MKEGEGREKGIREEVSEKQRRVQGLDGVGEVEAWKRSMVQRGETK